MNSIKDQLDAIHNEQPTEDNLKHIIENIVEQPENFKVFAKGLDLELTARGEYETSTGYTLHGAGRRKTLQELNLTLTLLHSSQPSSLKSSC